MQGVLMDFIKQHADTISIIMTILSALFYMHTHIENRFNALEKDIVVMKTVMIMKNIMPSELATKGN
jgi:hypothetical protein